MVSRPSSTAWRSLAQAFSQNIRRATATQERSQTERRQAGSRIELYHRVDSEIVRRPAKAFTGPLWTTLAASFERLRPGGRSVIFRKENRGESFQRQISNLRHQMQSGEEPGEDFDYDQDTSQFPRGQEPYNEQYERQDQASSEAESTATVAQRQTSWPSRDVNASVIAANAHWDGTLRSDGSLHVLGHADGELHAAEDLFVAEGAEVDAQLFADNVVVAGTVRGTVEARSRLEVLSQGHVAGDVKAPKLVVHEGARLSGQLKMETSIESGASATTGQYSKSQPGNKSRRGGQ